MKTAHAFGLVALLLAPVLLAPARAQGKGPAVGDVVLFHLAEGEDRPAIVVDDAGEDRRPVLHVFLAPGDAEAIVAAHNDAAMARGGKRRDGSDAAARMTTRGEAHTSLATALSGDGLTLAVDPDDWAAR